MYQEPQVGIEPTTARHPHPSPRTLQRDAAFRDKHFGRLNPPKEGQSPSTSGEHLANRLRARLRLSRIAAGTFRVERSAPPAAPNYVPALRHRPEGGAA